MWFNINVFILGINVLHRNPVAAAALAAPHVRAADNLGRRIRASTPV